MEVVEKCVKKVKEKNYMYFVWVLVRDIIYIWEIIDCRKNLIVRCRSILFIVFKVYKIDVVFFWVVVLNNFV